MPGTDVQANAAVTLLRINDFNKTYLTGLLNVRRAACTSVNTGYGNDTHITLKVKLTAIIN